MYNIIIDLVVMVLIAYMFYKHKKIVGEMQKKIDDLRAKNEVMAAQGDNKAGYNTEKINAVRTANRTQEDYEQYYETEYDSKRNEQS